MPEKTKTEIKKEPTLYELLSTPLPETGIQRSNKEQTKKGYDTTGYGYQFIVNRFNEVLGIGGWNWTFEELERGEGAYKSGGKFFTITGKSTITIFANEKYAIKSDISHTEFGGHQSSTITDALKGSATNALKKTASFFGVGRQAFEKTIDEDNKEQKGEIKSIKTEPKKVLMVGEICETIEKIKTKVKIEEFRSWVNNVKSYTEEQKNVMLRKLEEQEKVCE